MPPKKPAGGSGDADDDEKTGLDLLLYTLYAEAFAFRTLKQMKIWDYRLTYMSRSFSLAVIVYVLFIIVLDHGYLAKEEPIAGVDLSVSMEPLSVAWQRNATWQHPTGSSSNGSFFDLTAEYLNDENQTISVLTDPRFRAYCASGVTDYVWDAAGTVAYVNNTCVPYYTEGELIEQGYQNIWLYTYFRQESFSRNCTDSAVRPKYYEFDPPDFPYAPDSVKFFDFNDPGYVPNCAAPLSLVNTSVLTLQPERAVLKLVATYSTSWGRTRSSFSTTIEPLAGVTTSLPGTAPLSFAADEQISVNFSQLLAIAGVDLDAPNVLDDGGLGPPWPTFRLSGVRISAQLVFGNFLDFPNSTLDPFNFNDYLIIRLYPSSVGAFAGPGSRVFYTGHLFDLGTSQKWTNNESVGGLDQFRWPESLFTVRTPQGVQIQFHSAGLVGRFDGQVLLGALIGAIIMTKVAEKLTDMTASFVIDGFRAQKFMEDFEFRIRLMLRAQLLDSPSPEQVAMFEAEIVELYGDRMYKALTKRKRERAADALAKKKGGGKLVAVDEDVAKQKATKMAEDLAALAAAAADGDGPLVSAGGARRAAPGGAHPSRKPGGLASTTPTVTSLLISGDASVSSLLRAQGYLENCRCVRFQWYSSIGGRSYEPIPFAMMPTFFATADDVNCLIAVDAVPVTDDGFEGQPCRAKLGPLRIRSVTSARVAALVDEAQTERGCTVAGGVRGFGAITHVDEHQGGVSFAARLHVSGLSVAMQLSVEPADAPGKKSWRPAGSLAIRGLLCELDRQDNLLLRLRAPFGGASAPQLELIFAEPEQRDTVALMLRTMAREGGAAPAVAEDKEEAPTDDE